MEGEAASGISCGAEWVVSGGPGEGVGGTVRATGGCSSRRSDHGFLPEPGGKMDH